MLVNAHVRTMVAGVAGVPGMRGASATPTDAIAWRDGEILAVGSRAEVEHLAGPVLETWDVGGATVLPGFIDAHQHPAVVALYAGQVHLAPPLVTDIPSLLALLAEASAALPAGRWLVASEWDEMLLTERRPPTLEELDRAVPDRPLFAMHYTCHRAVANSHALALAGIDATTPDPPGGTIGRLRGKRGSPSGLLVERAMSPVEALARANLIANDLDGFMTRLGEHHAALLACGITRVVDATVPSDLQVVYREAVRRGVVRVPTVMMPVSVRGWLETPTDVLEGPVTGEEGEGGAGLLQVGSLKLVFDGAPVCAMCLGWWQVGGSLVRSWAMALRYRSWDPVRTAFSLKPRLGLKVRTGIHIYPRAEAAAIIRQACGSGFAVATHAIGNDALDLTLAAYEAAGGALGRAGQPRIEHGTFLGKKLIRRVVDAGVAVVTQPPMIGMPTCSSAAAIPGLPFFAHRWMLDAGVTVAASSDFPVTGFDPLDGLRAAVTRLTRPGPTQHVHEPDQRITLDEALTMYTRTAAEVSRSLGVCGTLESGKRADLVVLDGPLRDANDLTGARVRATILNGDVCFGDPASTAPRSA